MAGVNGIEIKVGQVWRTRGGEMVTVSLRDGNDTSYPWCVLTEGGDEMWVTNSGRDYESLDRVVDLIELVKDENGFTIWRGGEQPAETHGQEAVMRFRDGPTVKAPADKFNWTPDSANPIVAYKVVEEATQADSATLAEETLSALGWTFDGQAWVENAVVEMPIGMVPNALDVQVGGTHYKDCAIQPIEYIHANKLGFAEGNVVKYITRHRQKHGADDVRKVIHYCQLLLELEYGAATKEPTHG